MEEELEFLDDENDGDECGCGEDTCVCEIPDGWMRDGSWAPGG